MFLFFTTVLTLALLVRYLLVVVTNIRSTCFADAFAIFFLAAL